MNRSHKLKAIAQALSGETALLQRLKRESGQSTRPRTAADFEAMTDAELTALIEAGTGRPCPDYEVMSDEELDRIIEQYTVSPKP